MTKHEKLIVSVYTGIAMCNFPDIHEYVEKIVGRPVYTHEFASEEFMKELKEKVKPEFLALCAEDGG